MPLITKHRQVMVISSLLWMVAWDMSGVHLAIPLAGSWTQLLAAFANSGAALATLVIVSAFARFRYCSSTVQCSFELHAFPFLQIFFPPHYLASPIARRNQRKA